MEAYFSSQTKVALFINLYQYEAALKRGLVYNNSGHVFMMAAEGMVCGKCPQLGIFVLFH